MEPIPFIDRLNDTALSDKGIHGIDVDPIADGQQQENQHQRFQQSQKSAQDTVYRAKYADFIDKRRSDLAQQPGAQLDDQERRRSRSHLSVRMRFPANF